MTRSLVVLALVFATAARADHLLDHVFSIGRTPMVPMDIRAIDLTITFDVAAKTATGTARVTFEVPARGLPFFTMRAEPTRALLDGGTTVVMDVPTPHPRTRVRALETVLEPGSVHELELAYSLSREEVGFGRKKIGFLTSMSDLDEPGNYFEAYGPSNIEADAYALTLTLRVSGAKPEPRLFTNGVAARVAGDGTPTWIVKFPEWYTTSSFFVHLTNSGMHVIRGTVAGEERDIPFTVYSPSRRRAREAASRLPAIFAELEETYGPYHHESFTALISGAGGMEHCGATITSVGALAHELTHSWFARGVMPSAGRDGWMDEAIASWRDYGYERAEPRPGRPMTNLAGFSIHNPFAPFNVYADGRALLAELDSMFARTTGGLRPLLRTWYGRARGTAVSTEDFQRFLEDETRLSLQAQFDRFVLGKGRPGGTSFAEPAAGSMHPPKLTRAEILQLR